MFSVLFALNDIYRWYLTLCYIKVVLILHCIGHNLLLMNDISNLKQKKIAKSFDLCMHGEKQKKANVDLYNEHEGSVWQLRLAGKLPPSASDLSLQHG